MCFIVYWVVCELFINVVKYVGVVLVSVSLFCDDG